MTRIQEILMRSISQGQGFRQVKQLIDRLTNHGNNPQKLNFTDNEGTFGDVGDTILHLASKNNDTRTIGKIIRILPQLKNSKNSLGWTPLHTAAMFQNVQVVNYLINRNADVEIRDNNGKSFIDYLRGTSISTVREVYELKYGEGSMPNPQVDTGWMANYYADNVPAPAIVEAPVVIQYAENPLIQAAEQGGIQAVVELLTRGININISDGFGMTALMYAAQNDDFLLAEELLRRGADIHKINSTGMTALDIATQHNNFTVQETLQTKLSLIENTGLVPELL